MRKALIVGIDDYPNNPLTGCVADANAVATVLSTNGDGSPNFAVQVCTSPSTRVDKPTLRAAIERLFQGDSDTALLYFSGHGHITSTGGYLVTVDAQRYDEGLSMDDVITLANNSNARNKIIIFDCCYSGAAGTPRLTGGNVASLGEGISILTASTDSEEAMEVNGRGVFTSLVVEALQGGAADVRGNITPGSLYAYVDEALGAWDQRPIFKTNVSSFAKLRQIQPRVAFETLRKITDYFPDPASEHSLDPSYEPDCDQANENNTAIFKDLQAFVKASLVVPVGEEHMYYAAMNSKSCRLTAMGAQYWRLVRDGKL
jgi:hypothetical protein